MSSACPGRLAGMIMLAAVALLFAAVVLPLAIRMLDGEA